MIEQYWWLTPLGFVAGAYGTLIGAGGGFLLVPALLLLYPNERPETITSISLAVVFFNGLSGSVAYARMRRIDYRSGLLFSAATVPGAVLGALSTSLVPRRHFDLAFASILVAVSIFLLVRPHKLRVKGVALRRRHLSRNFTAADGTDHSFSYNLLVAVPLSIGVGFLASFLGIGGGIIHVPAMVHLLDFPPHVATATSQFILTITSLTGSATHVITGVFSTGFRRMIFLAVGVLIGAQIGAAISNRVRGPWIMRALAIALLLVGVRLLALAL